VALLLSFAVSTIISVVANLISAGVGVATSVATGGGRHHVSDPTALPFALGVGILGIAVHSVSFIVSLAVSAFFTAGVAKFSLKVARGEPYSFGDVFSGGPYVLSVFVAHLITVFAVSIGLVFLIVPGVILALGLCMSVPLIVDRNLGPIEALTESWKITDGNRANLFILWLIGVALAIAGLCACGVGILLVAPLLGIAYLYVYLRITGQPVAQIAAAPPR
jgi:uncharacterized membrane protein